MTVDLAQPGSRLGNAGSTVPAEILSDAILTIDADLKVTLWSDAAERLYGIAPATALGRPFTDLIACHPHVGRAASSADRLAAIGLVNGSGTHVVRSVGRRVSVRVSVASCGGGSHCGDSVVVVRDDTEHRRLTQSLQERLEFEMLLSEMSARFTRLSEEHFDSEIQLWLRRLVEMLGVDRCCFAEMTPTGQLAITHSFAVPGVDPYAHGPVDKSLPWLTQELAAARTVVLAQIPEDLPECAVAERRVFTESAMKAGIAVPVSLGGSLVCVLMFAAFRRPRVWPAEVVSRLHLAGEVFANGLARRQSKQRLNQVQQALAHVGRVADMGRLASVVAHELDQPLTTVVTNAQAVRNMLQMQDPDYAEIDDALSDVINAAMRASEIVRREHRLLRKSEVAFESVNLNDALREVEVFVRTEARQYGARVIFDLLPGLAAVRGDRVQLQQVALNLIRNGLQAVRQQPAARREVAVRTALGIREVILSVTDSGPAVEATLLEQMFDTFFTTKPNGLGMGLSIGKSIVESHGGRIWPTCNAEGGLTMHVSIPRE